MMTTTPSCVQRFRNGCGRNNFALTREPPVLYFARINPGSAGRRGLCKGCVSSAMIDASLPSRLGEGSAPNKLPDPT
jgi:hypothetical protein